MIALPAWAVLLALVLLPFVGWWLRGRVQGQTESSALVVLRAANALKTGDEYTAAARRWWLETYDRDKDALYQELRNRLLEEFGDYLSPNPGEAG